MTMRKLVFAAVAIGVLLAMGLVVFADYRMTNHQQSAEDSYKLLQVAKERFSTGEMAEAERLFKEAAIKQETNGEAWFMYGLCRHYAKDWTGARNAFEKAIDLGHMPELGLYNIACGYAREGNIEMSLQFLETALDRGFTRSSYLTSDPDLRNLRSDPRFQALISKVSSELEEDPIASYMADWLGEWDVYEGDRWIGSAQYVEAMNGYAIELHFSNYVGQMSQGLYTFDANKKEWRRMLVDESGRISESIGKLTDGENFIFVGQVTDPKEAVTYHERVSWQTEPDGAINVKIENSQDGESWTVAQTLSYVRHSSD